MTEKNSYWMRLPADGTYARIEGAAERDRLVPLGWEEGGDPADTDFVWMHRADIERPARFAYGAAETWRVMGWEFSAPPAPVDVTKDPLLFVQPEAKKPTSETTTTSKSATAAEKTKE